MKPRFALAGGSALLLATGGLSVFACSTVDIYDAAAPDAATGDASASNPADASITDSAPGATTDGDAGADSASTGADAGDGQDAAADSGEDAGIDGGADGGEIADADAGPSAIVDVYGCGTPHDCANGESCFITATPGWDGGDFPASTACALQGAIGSLCKSTPLPSDVQVCADLHDGGFTPCPTGTTCQVVQVFAKSFGACLSEPASSCHQPEYVPYADALNYCFAANTVGGCSSPNVVCCDKADDGVYTASCAATVAGCK